MFKSIDVPYLKPSSSRSVSLMLGNGNGLRFMRWFSWRKSVMNQTVWSFFGIICDGACHSELFILRSTPILHNRSNSSMRVARFATGQEYGFSDTGLQLESFSSSRCWTPFHFPSVPSNRLLCFLSTTSSCCFIVSVRGGLLSRICWGDTGAYFASSISVTCLTASAASGGSQILVAKSNSLSDHWFHFQQQQQQYWR